MGSKWRYFFICFLMAAVFILEPVSYVLASDTVPEAGESFDRVEKLPRLNSSEIKFNYGKYWDWFGLVKHDNPIVIEELVLAHLKLDNIDYSLYDLVCDFELKTMVGSDIKTSDYSYTIDFAEYKKGFIDSLLVRFNLKDDYFEHVFNYYDIVSKADGFMERVIEVDDRFSTYNTVISQVDFYFVRKSDGEIGEARRFKFTWDSDFWMQKCKKIDFSWYRVEEDYEKPVSSVEDENGVFGFSTNTLDSYLNIEGSAWNEILWLILDIPAALVALVLGFVEMIGYLGDLFSALFPFIPAVIFDIFGVIILLLLGVEIYQLIFGD